MTKNCWKFLYICVFTLSKKRPSWFHKNLHNSGMVGRRKLPDPSLNHIFNALSIGVQYTVSFQLTNFGLKCLISTLSGKKESGKNDSIFCKWVNFSPTKLFPNFLFPRFFFTWQRIYPGFSYPELLFLFPIYLQNLSLLFFFNLSIFNKNFEIQVKARNWKK